jgi:hypothetical protein
MTPTIFAGFLAAIGSILVAGATYWLTKKREREAEWRKAKFEHYKEFFASFGGNLMSTGSPEGRMAYARARNNLALVAPQPVIEALQAFEKVIAITNVNNDIDRHDEFLSRLIFEIRRDLQISPSDNSETFRVGIVGAGARRIEP